MKFLPFFITLLSLSSTLATGSASSDLVEDDEEFSIPPAQEQQEQIPIISQKKNNYQQDGSASAVIQGDAGDVEDVVTAKEHVKLPEVDISKLPLLDWKTAKPSDFWFEVSLD